MFHQLNRRVALPVLVALLLLPGPGRATQAPAPLAAPPESSLTVVSLNLALREDVDQIAAELSAAGIAQTADVLLLQEVLHRKPFDDIAVQLGEHLGFESVYREAFAIDDDRSSGLAVLSRYPLRDPHVLNLRRFDLGFRSRNRIALGTWVETSAGPVHVVNVHLDTRLNLRPRLEQLESVARHAESLGGPAIVGGDFNTNNNRWLFSTIPLPFMSRQGAGLKRYMESLGFRSAFENGRPTHDALGMQLDWVFLRGLDARAGSIRPMQVSDHHALVVSVVPAEDALSLQ